MTVEVFLLYINEMKSLMKKKVVASAAAAWLCLLVVLSSSSLSSLHFSCPSWLTTNLKISTAKESRSMKGEM
jgi:hypothetical protein